MVKNETIAARLLALRAQIDHLAREAGRDPGEVRLIAVSKTLPVEAVASAVAAGQRSREQFRAWVKANMVKLDTTAG